MVSWLATQSSRLTGHTYLDFPPRPRLCGWADLSMFWMWYGGPRMAGTSPKYNCSWVYQRTFALDSWKRVRRGWMDLRFEEIDDVRLNKKERAANVLFPTQKSRFERNCERAREEGSGREVNQSPITVVVWLAKKGGGTCSQSDIGW